MTLPRKLLQLTCILLAGIIVSTCFRLDPVPKLLVSTRSVDNVGATEASASGVLSDMPEGGAGDHGFCWATHGDPSLEDHVRSLGGKASTGLFSGSIEGLDPGTRYYLRAYGTHGTETIYGDTVRFITLSGSIPELDALVISQIGNSSVQISGKLISDGGLSIEALGICWSTSANPTPEDAKLQLNVKEQVFSQQITGLSCGSTYYIRAFATNAMGTGYGQETSFNTTGCVAGLPTVITSAIGSITESGALGGGTVSNDGGSSVSARGVCWGTEALPEISGRHSVDGNGTGNFVSSITGLSCETSYYVRAYATNDKGTAYGDAISFTSATCPGGMPVVETATLSNITESTATCGGTVSSDGGKAVTERGVCWSTSPSPSIEDSRSRDGSGTGSFTSTLTGLECGTVYYVRAYATNEVGTDYGTQLSFTTSSCPVPPSVSTSAVSIIAQYSATGGGTVNSDGGSPVTERGLCWSATATEPGISDSFQKQGSGTGSFEVEMTGLSCGTTYYVRAFARNAVGLTYGSARSFTTAACPANLPTVSTASVSEITQTSATAGGNVTDDGGAAVTARGICWNTSGTPTTSDYSYSAGSGTGSFEGYMNGLSPGTTYYVSAWATNSAGTNYGAAYKFTTEEESNTVRDYDGNVYQTVQIGDQVWMAENIRTTHYADGWAIAHKPGTSEWAALGSSDRAYCWYDNSTANRDIYGGLYTWAAAVRSTGSSANPSGIQGVCPDGWHIPSDAEWKQLEMYLGMSSSEADKTGRRIGGIGGKLKEEGTSHWSSPNTGASNSSLFNALPGGYRNIDGASDRLGEMACFWSSTESSGAYSYDRKLYNTSEDIWRDVWYKYNGFSVRCVKD